MRTFAVESESWTIVIYWHTHITISFSYAYLNGFERFMVSSPCVEIRVHRPSLAMSPLITEGGTPSQHIAIQSNATHYSSALSLLYHLHYDQLQYGPHSACLHPCPMLDGETLRRTCNCSSFPLLTQRHPWSSRRARHTKEFSTAWSTAFGFA